MPTVVLVQGPGLDIEGGATIRLLPGVPVKMSAEDAARAEHAAKKAGRRYRVFADPRPVPPPVPAKKVVKAVKAAPKKAAKKAAKG